MVIECSDVASDAAASDAVPASSPGAVSDAVPASSPGAVSDACELSDTVWICVAPKTGIKGRPPDSEWSDLWRLEEVVGDTLDTAGRTLLIVLSLFTSVELMF